jgi:hypothetical protein
METNSSPDPVTGGVSVQNVCSPKEHVADLSTNLHGVFRLEHCSIELTPQGKQDYALYCAPNEVVEPPLEHIHFSHNAQRGFWSIPVRRLHGQLVEYNQSNLPFKAECMVTHTPMKWNFWHFSLRWRLEDGRQLHDLPDKERQKTAKRVAHDARALIAKFARYAVPPDISLEERCYLQ